MSHHMDDTELDFGLRLSFTARFSKAFIPSNLKIIEPIQLFIRPDRQFALIRLADALERPPLLPLNSIGVARACCLRAKEVANKSPNIP